MIAIPNTERYLIMVDPCTNQDKYFKMIPSDDNDTFLVEYNEVGRTGIQKSYPMAKWNALYTSKIARGYVDKTEIRESAEPVKKKKKKNKAAAILCKGIQILIQRLQSASQGVVEENYQLEVEHVTETMIEEAQKILDHLGNCNTMWSFNDTLMKLFAVIPRRMSNVMEHCANSEKDFGEIISREQDILDNMKIQKKQLNSEEEQASESQTILETMGLEMAEVTESQKDEILNLMDSVTKQSFSQAWEVTNKETEKNYQTYKKKKKITKTRLLFHGSRTENWWSILASGLVLHPTNARISGAMFGHGLYFASLAKKSDGYTDGGYWTGGMRQNLRYMAIYEVAYGTPYEVTSYSNEISNLTPATFKAKYPDKNCLHAKAGASIINDEIIVFSQEACTIRYLIELK